MLKYTKKRDEAAPAGEAPWSGGEGAQDALALRGAALSALAAIVRRRSDAVQIGVQLGAGGRSRSRATSSSSAHGSAAALPVPASPDKAAAGSDLLAYAVLCVLQPAIMEAGPVAGALQFVEACMAVGVPAARVVRLSVPRMAAEAALANPADLAVQGAAASVIAAAALMEGSAAAAQAVAAGAFDAFGSCLDGDSLGAGG